MSNPLFRESPGWSSKPIRIGVNLFENITEASQDPEVYKALSRVRERPFVNSDDIADGFMDAMKVSQVLTGEQKKKILQEIICGQLVFSRVKRDMILQYSVDVIEKEIEPKALAFVFLLQEIFWRNKEERWPFIEWLRKCYHAMDDESRKYIREQLLAEQAAPSVSGITVTVWDQEGKLYRFTRAEIAAILAPEASPTIKSVMLSIGQQLLSLLPGRQKE